jgi:hypothetical protein
MKAIFKGFYMKRFVCAAVLCTMPPNMVCKYIGIKIYKTL